jgi:hypothetical protein
MRTAVATTAWLALATGCGRSPVAVLGLAGSGGGDEGVVIRRCGEDPEDAFAQVVVGYEPTAGGGDVPLREDVVDPEAALGAPDHMPMPPLGTVSIGDGGTLTVGFEPCVMGTDLSNTPDLFIHEAGFDEQTTVELRPTAAARIVLGPWVDADGYVQLDRRPDAAGGIDVDAMLVAVPVDGLRFDAVRIRDVTGQGLETVETPGADIDAVEIAVPLAAE